MTKLHDQAPPFCAACYGQYPERRHVDFEAAYDGPVINTDGLRQTIDDLIVCEACLAEAAPLLGWVPDEGRELERLHRELEAARRENADLGTYVRRLEATVSERPAQLPPARNVGGRPRKDGSPAQPRAKELV